ncbi:S1C family serine protease [Frankia sp. Cas3]|uniref:S1C family serine protease n=1 Tax=Frankia sp. Cas3 TaxID=3073926 RepID=UPI002AD370CC|nr:trypsin-like peptidase domain-containing protein [Frankia sp. Cas3]
MVGEERPGTSAWRLRAAALGCVTACMTGSAVAIGTGTPASGMAGGLLDATIVPGPAIRTFAAPGLVTAATGSPIPSQRSGVADRVTPGVVRIVSTLASQSGSAAGTGMVLNSAGEVLTNNHVIQDAASITVTVASTGRAYPAAVVGADATNDVAVLQLRGAAGLTTVPIGDSAKISIGASVAAVGNAEGGAPTVVTGAVTALNQSITATDPGGGNAEQLTGLIRTNLAIKPGFSGGPLVSAAGQVVGMDTAATMFNEYLPAGMRAGYSIPINHAMAVAHQLEATKPAGTAGTAGGDDGRGAAAGTATGTATAARPGSSAARVVMTTAARRTGDVHNEGEDGADGRRNAPVAPVRAILPQVGQRPARPSRRRPGRQSGSSQPRG